MDSIMENINLQFRMANKEDLNIINDVLCLSKAYWGYDKPFMIAYMENFGITEEYLNRALKFVLMILSSKIVGFYSFSINAEQTLELDNFFLHPDLIGKGLGRKLWAESVKTAHDLGVKEFILWGDPNAAPFYLKMGCQKIGERQSPVMPNRFPPILKYVI